MSVFKMIIDRGSKFIPSDTIIAALIYGAKNKSYGVSADPKSYSLLVECDNKPIDSGFYGITWFDLNTKTESHKNAKREFIKPEPRKIRWKTI